MCQGYGGKSSFFFIVFIKNLQSVKKHPKAWAHAEMFPERAKPHGLTKMVYFRRTLDVGILTAIHDR